MLDQIRVLDLTDDRGQLCGQMLAMMGAEVIAVEPPGGSRSRRIGPFAGGAADKEASLFHWAYNRGKRSIELDLESDDGRDELLRLAAGADVLVESAGAGVMASLGLGPDVVADVNPALVYVSISAFGQTGPKSQWVESDLVVAAASGVLNLTGDEDRPPVRVTLPQAYHHAAIDAACAVMVGLHDRNNHSGLGQYADISAQQSYSVATQSFLLSAPCNGMAASRVAGGVRVEGIDAKVQLLWPCKDGQVSVTFLFGAAIATFTQNLMNWVHEEGYCDEATRDKDWELYANMLFDGSEPIEQYERVKECVGDLLITKTKAELLEASFDRRVLIAPVTTSADVVGSPQWSDRGFWEEVDTPAGAVTFPGPFAKLTATPLRQLPAAPAVGEHTVAVRAEPDRTVGLPDGVGPETAPDLPLAGVKVLDLMWVFAGPFASRTMAELGAEVIRVESTTSLDALRTSGNFQDDRMDPDWAVQFTNVNVGKRGIALDLGRPEARDVVHDLVRWADVTMESFSPKAMAGWGYGYDALREVRPDLIMTSSCLMGQTGPHRLLAGFGTMAAAVSGFFHLTGWPDRPPCGPFMAYTDYVSPRFLLVSVLAALEHRRRTGEGQYIDVSQAEASMHLQIPNILDYTVNGNVMDRAGNDDHVFAPHGVYPVEGNDRWLAVSVADDRQWKALCETIGRGDLETLSSDDRRDRRRELDGVIEEWTAGRDGTEAMNTLQAAGVGAHIVANTVDALADPQLQHRNHFVQTSHEAMGTTWVEGPRLHFSRTSAQITSAGPTLGEHTWEVLTEVLGYDPDQAAELLALGIFE